MPSEMSRPRPFSAPLSSLKRSTVKQKQGSRSNRCQGVPARWNTSTSVTGDLYSPRLSLRPKYKNKTDLSKTDSLEVSTRLMNHQTESFALKGSEGTRARPRTAPLRGLIMFERPPPVTKDRLEQRERERRRSPSPETTLFTKREVEKKTPVPVITDFKGGDTRDNTKTHVTTMYKHVSARSETQTTSTFTAKPPSFPKGRITQPNRRRNRTRVLEERGVQENHEPEPELEQRTEVAHNEAAALDEIDSCPMALPSSIYDDPSRPIGREQQDPNPMLRTLRGVDPIGTYVPPRHIIANVTKRLENAQVIPLNKTAALGSTALRNASGVGLTDTNPLKVVATGRQVRIFNPLTHRHQKRHLHRMEREEKETKQLDSHTDKFRNNITSTDITAMQHPNHDTDHRRAFARDARVFFRKPGYLGSLLDEANLRKGRMF